MIPIGDYAGERRQFPFINIALLILNILAFVYTAMQPLGQLDQFFSRWGAVPQEIITGTDLPPTVQAPIYLTLLTSIFLHGGLLHLGGNMLYLWVFGDNVENAFGSLKYLIFYLLCGLGASAAQIAIAPHSMVPIIGASGAIAGVMGAYLVLFPGAMVRTLVLINVVYLPAIFVIGIWFLLQLFYGITSLGGQTQEGDGIAFFAHVGGLVIGALLALLFRRRAYRQAAPTSIRGYGRW